jgi:hypothetical protein
MPKPIAPTLRTEPDPDTQARPCRNRSFLALSDTCVQSGIMDGNRKRRRQQATMLIVGALAAAVAFYFGIDLALNEGSGGRWWSFAGASLTCVAMILGWFNLQSLRRKSADARDEGSANGEN